MNDQIINKYSVVIWITMLIISGALFIILGFIYAEPTFFITGLIAFILSVAFILLAYRNYYKEPKKNKNITK